MAQTLPLSLLNRLSPHRCLIAPRAAAKTMLYLLMEAAAVAALLLR
jgi:hypothetical protein